MARHNFVSFFSCQHHHFSAFQASNTVNSSQALTVLLLLFLFLSLSLFFSLSFLYTIEYTDFSQYKSGHEMRRQFKNKMLAPVCEHVGWNSDTETLEVSINEGFSKCALQIGSIDIIWELVRNENACALPQTYWISSWEEDRNVCFH